MGEDRQRILEEHENQEPDEAMKKYQVDLTAAERDELLRLSRSGKTSGRKLTRARILLKADEQLADEEIAETVGTSVATIERTRQRFVEEGLDALNERPRLGARPKLTAKGAAHVIAVACSPAPGGRKRWTLRLLADRAVELGLCSEFSHESVRRLLKKTSLNPGNTSSGVSPK
jgi:transposase